MARKPPTITLDDLHRVRLKHVDADLLDKLSEWAKTELPRRESAGNGAKARKEKNKNDNN